MVPLRNREVPGFSSLEGSPGEEDGLSQAGRGHGALCEQWASSLHPGKLLKGL